MTTQRRTNVQRFRIAWLEQKVISPKEYADSRRQLKAMTHSFKAFSNADECAESLFSFSHTKDGILLIVSETLGKDVLPLVHSLPHIHRIYLYSSNPSHAESWTKQYEKVRGNVFPNIQSICDQIQADITNPDAELVSISVVSHTEIRAGNRLDPSFMYKQLLKDILLNDHSSDPEDVARRQMIEFCRQVYRKDSRELRAIDEFEKGFNPSQAVTWYTRDCFLYKMLNKALWTPEPVTLYKLRYFLRHLHKQIQTTAAEQSASALNPTKTKTVYRGQGIPTTEIDGLKKGVGGLLSFNNFLSTSLSPNVARKFVEDVKHLPGQTPVMFTMSIDPSIRRCPFMEIGQMGYFQNQEEEILFSTGTVFRIEAVEPLSDGQWKVRLVFSGDVDDNLAWYTDKMRRKTRGNHPLVSLVKLMDEMGQYKMIDQFDSLFAENEAILQNLSVTSAFQHALGSAYLSAGNRTKALHFLQESLKTCRKYRPEGHPSLSPTYNNIGSVHHANKDYPNALKYYRMALDCQVNADDPDLESIGAYSKNIASVYQLMGEYDEALVHLSKTLEIQRKTLGEDHPALSNTYNGMAVIYHAKKDYKQASKSNKIIFCHNRIQRSSMTINIYWNLVQREGKIQLRR